MINRIKLNIVIFLKKIKNLEFIISLGNLKLGNFQIKELAYDLLNKEEEGRKFVLSNIKNNGKKLQFLDVGGRDGSLKYLLGDKGNFSFDKTFYKNNKTKFDELYNYYGLDIIPAGNNVLFGDICSHEFKNKYKEKEGFFDIIYSNNVFEHLTRPWVAAENINFMLKKGGTVITIAPFSIRYHSVPGDFFRYTHTAIESLFSDYSKYEVLKTGYDIKSRRNNWQGTGKMNDIVPIDNFGAWREAWFIFTALKKLD